MRKKKNPNVDLERRKTSFFLAGLVLAIGGAIGVINLQWGIKEIKPTEVEFGENDIAVEIQPTVTKVPPRVRKPLAVVTDKIIIKNIIEPTVTKEPEIKIADLTDVLEGEEDPSIETIEFIDVDGTEEAEAVPFVLVEKFPRFNNCAEGGTKDEQKQCFEENLLKHISSNFKYPTNELEMGLEEKVYVEFVISKTGEVSDVQIVRGNMGGFIKESKRLINSLPKVKPAEQRGKPVNMKYTIPIKFQIKR